MIKVYLPLYRSEIKEMLNEIEEITLEKEELNDRKIFYYVTNFFPFPLFFQF